MANAIPWLADDRHRVRLAVEDYEVDLAPELQQTHVHLLGLLQRRPKVTRRRDDAQRCRHPVCVGHWRQPPEQIRVLPGFSAEGERTEVPGDIARSVERLQIADRAHRDGGLEAVGVADNPESGVAAI